MAIALKSFSAVATNVTEAEYFVRSIRRLYDLPIYLATTFSLGRYIKERYDDIIVLPWCEKEILNNVDVSGVADPGTHHNARIISKKFDIFSYAIRDAGNSILLDSDVILLKPIHKSMWVGADVMLSPHYYARDRKNNSVKFGIYNAGYIWATNSAIAEEWKYLYNNDSTFFEQECMNRIPLSYDSYTFSRIHNYGFWRLRYTKDSTFNEKKRRVSHLSVLDDNDIRNEIVSLHCRFVDYDYGTEYLNSRMMAFASYVEKLVPDDINIGSYKFSTTVP